MARNLRSGLRQSLNAGLAGGFANNDIFTTASLDLSFAKYKNLGPLVDATTGTNLIDFSRASLGTYVGSDGLIKTATTNYLLYSEPDNALTGWGIGFSTGTFSHTIIDSPFAVGKTAVRHVQSVSGRSYLDQNVYVNASTTYTLSFYVDKTQSEITSGDIVVLAVSNITGGTVSGDDSLTFSDAVNGKNTITFTTSSGVSSFQIRAGVGVYGNSTGTLVFGNLQLEQSSTVGEYIPTTSTINSAPRFDHDPTTGESLGLLVEESRANLRSYSESILTTNGYSGVSATLASSSVTTPTGASSGASLFALDSGADTGNTSSGTNFGSSISLTSGLVYTSSIFVKSAGGSVLRLRNNAAGGIYDYTLSGAGIAPSITSELQGATIQSFPGGWYRCSWTYTAKATAPGNRGDYWAIKTDVNDGTSGIYLWGAQLEEGSFPTSYIPTEGSTVTRAADVASISGSNFSSWYRQDEGTVFASIVGVPITSGQFPRIYEMNDGTSNNVIRSQQYGSNTVRNNVVSGGTNYMAQDGGIIAKGSKGKTAFALAENNCAIVTNGEVPVIDDTVTLPSNLDQISILGTTSGTSVANSTIARLTFWPTRLPNETLQGITQQ